MATDPVRDHRIDLYARAPEQRPSRLLLSVDEVQDLLGVGRNLIFALLSTGELESIKIGRRRLVPVGAVDRYIAARLADARSMHDGFEVDRDVM